MSIRLPDPIANTTTEAYLAYKAGVLAEDDLKPKLYEPYIHLDAWLAYWAGLVNTYPLDKDNNPEMLTDEEAFIAYLSGVTNTYPEEFRDPADIRVAGYLRYLISARWGRPEYPVNNEEFYLSLMKTKYIPSGDPSSDIEIEGTAEAPFVDVKMYGDTYQKSYAGKNLLVYPYYDTTKNPSGLTFTDNGDGSVTIDGTLTANEVLFWITRDIWSYNTSNIVVPAGTYTLSPTGDEHVRLYVSAYGETQGLLDSWNSTTTPVTFTVSEKASLTVRISVKPEGAAVNNLVVKPQLEAGSTSSPFEPYVGGVPSPNPDYPQTVQTVTGEQTVEVQGKNLFDKSTEESGWLNNTGGISQPTSTSDKTSAYIPATPNTAYTLSSPGYYLKIAQYDSSKTFIKLDTTGNNIPSNTITTEANTAYLRISYGNAQNQPNVMLERGLTASDYAPYSKHSYEINLGKNLFDKNNARIYALNPITAGSAVSPLTNACSTFIPITAGTTYTVSSTNRSLLDTYASVYFISGTPDTATTWITRTSFGQNSSVTVTAPAGATYLGMYFLYSNNQTTIANAEATIQIEMGSTATSYASYFTPIELCELGTYQDYIWKDGEDWKVHKATGKYVFTGEEEMSWDSSIPRVYIGYPVLNALGIYPVYPLNVDTLPTAANSKFAGKTFSAFYTNAESNGFAMSTSGRNFNFGNKSWTTSTEARSDIKGNICYYAKASGQITDTIITNQILIDQLEALVNGGAEEGTTYIKVNATDPNLPALLVVEAPKYE